MFNSNDKQKVSNTQSKTSNIIQAQTTIKGSIETKGSLRVDGTILGDINSSNKVVLGNQSKIEGNLVALNADISGALFGSLLINETTILRSTAVIKGDISTNNLIMESGAVFNGECKMPLNSSKSTNSK